MWKKKGSWSLRCSEMGLINPWVDKCLNPLFVLKTNIQSWSDLSGHVSFFQLFRKRKQIPHVHQDRHTAMVTLCGVWISSLVTWSGTFLLLEPEHSPRNPPWQWFEDVTLHLPWAQPHPCSLSIIPSLQGGWIFLPRAVSPIISHIQCCTSPQSSKDKVLDFIQYFAVILLSWEALSSS